MELCFLNMDWFRQLLPQDLLSKRAVVGETCGPCAELVYCQTVCCSLCKLDAEADHRVEAFVSQMLPNFRGHGLHKIELAPVQRDQRAGLNLVTCFPGQQIQGLQL